MKSTSRSIGKCIVSYSMTSDDSLGLYELDQTARVSGTPCATDGLACKWHFVINRKGIIELGHSESDIGIHTNKYEKDAILVCVVGGLGFDRNPSNNWNRAQKMAFKELVIQLKEDYPNIEIQSSTELPIPGAGPILDKECLP